MLCVTGPMYLDDLQCERGLVTSHAPDRAFCITVKMMLSNTMIYNVNENHYIVVSRGENYGLTCDGRSQQKGIMPSGAFEIDLPCSCTLRWDNWLIKSPKRKGLNVQIGRNKLPIDKVVFSMINMSVSQVEAMQGGVPTLPPMVDIPIRRVPTHADEEFQPEMFHHVAHHSAYVGVGIAVVSIIVICIFGKYIYAKWEKIRFYLGTVKKVTSKIKPRETGGGSDQPDIELQEVTPTL